MAWPESAIDPHQRYENFPCRRLAGIDPVDHFADVLVRVGSHPASRIEELLPENWARRFGAAATA